jgi:pimeloyl-ACP methyl ester carboxylesterase
MAEKSDQVSDLVETFLRSDELGRLEKAQDPSYEAALRGHLGEQAFAELQARAQQVLNSPGHLGAKSPKNLVFVPGVMGTLLAPVHVPAGIWWVDPRAHEFIDKLGLAPDGGDPVDEAKHVGPLQVDLSYTGFLSLLFQRNDFGVETYPYDWRKPLTASTEGLRDLVLRMHQGNGGRPVHLVAHSMGGLVVRAALAAYGADLWPKLGKIVFLGTPHYGSTAIAFYLKNHFWGFDLMAVLGVLLSRETFRSMWGPLTLLPAPRGIYPGTRPNDPKSWSGQGAGDPYVHPCTNFDLYKAEEWRLDLNAQETKMLQRILDHVADFHQRLYDSHVGLEPRLRNKMLVIAGVGHKTPFRLANGSVLGVWPKMEKITSRLDGDRHREGDGSVPLASAELEWVGDTRYVPGKHGSLPNYKAVVDEVIRWLLGQTLRLSRSARQGAATPHLGSAPATASHSPYLDGSATGANPDDRWEAEATPPERLAHLKERLETGQLRELEAVKLL